MPRLSEREEEEEVGESLVSTASGSGCVKTHDDKISHCMTHFINITSLFSSPPPSVYWLRSHSTITPLQFQAPTMLCLKSNTKGSVWKHSLFPNSVGNRTKTSLPLIACFCSVVTAEAAELKRKTEPTASHRQ